MTRLDRVLKLLEDYDDLLETLVDQDIVLAVARLDLKELRKEKDQLTQELIERGCRRGIDIISQDIFSEKPKMIKETWCG